MSLSLLRMVISAALLTSAIVAAPVVLSKKPEAGTLENIHGIPFPTREEGITVVTEQLAHMDAYVHEPVFGKALVLTLSFRPHDIGQLDVGVRDGAFWLSYRRHPVYRRSDADERTGSSDVVTKRIVIPLTDKFQDVDRSLDVMFFAGEPIPADMIDAGISDTTFWVLEDVHVQTAFHRPAPDEMKDYLRSIILRERAE